MPHLPLGFSLRAALAAGAAQDPSSTQGSLWGETWVLTSLGWDFPQASVPRELNVLLLRKKEYKIFLIVRKKKLQNHPQCH